MRHSIGPHQRGMTLVEVLVSVAIATILLAILLPAVQYARDAARRTSCRNNMRQMGLALHAFQAVHGRFPPGASPAFGLALGPCDPEEIEVEDNPGVCTDFAAWSVACLPFLDQGALASKYHYELAWSSLDNRQAVASQLPVFACPTAPAAERVDRHHVLGAAATDYGAVLQVDRGVFTELFGVPDPGLAARQSVLAEYESSSPASIRDGLSNTLMVVECAGRAASYVLRKPMSATQFARYRDDDVLHVAGRFVVADGIGWADPDSGFSVEGTGKDGVEIYGPRMINATNVGEAYSFHRRGVNVLYAGGSIRFVHDDIDPWVYVSLVTRAGGENIGRFCRNRRRGFGEARVD